jgi:prepilin-type N-terminal cleavage/methylation domain-containing protein
MRSNRAFSLIELLLVLAVGAVLMAAFFNSLAASSRSQDKQSSLEQAESEFESVLLSLETDAARAGFLSADPETAAWFASNWPASYPSLAVSSSGGYDSLTIRWAASGSDCPTGAEYSVTLASGNVACLRRVRYYVSDTGLVRDLDEAGPVTISPYAIEAFDVFFRSSTGGWSASLPPAGEDRNVAAYVRVAAPYKGDAGCGGYPKSELLEPYGGAAAIGVSTVDYTSCRNTLRLEQVVSSALVNQQQY